MNHKIIQWNCCWLKLSFNKLLILLTTLNSSVVCLQETFLQKNNNYKIKNYYFGGACGVMVIIVGNGHGDMSSNLGQD